MKRNLVETPSASGAGTLPDPEIITTEELARRVQVCSGTIGNWRRSGKLAYISMPGRLVRFHWPSTRDALLRMQKGGV